MQNVIDLGNEVVIDVKYAGATYKMREPTVGEIDQFRASNLEENGATAIVGFLEKLGMPKAVVMGMGMSKARQLIDGLMEMLTKKK